jgi:hypothetical protein
MLLTPALLSTPEATREAQREGSLLLPESRRKTEEEVKRREWGSQQRGKDGQNEQEAFGRGRESRAEERRGEGRGV